MCLLILSNGPLSANECILILDNNASMESFCELSYAQVQLIHQNEKQYAALSDIFSTIWSKEEPGWNKCDK